MAWDTRPNGRCYLYRSVRRGGTVTREYLGAGGVLGGGGPAETTWRVEKLLRLQLADAQRECRARPAELGRLLTADDGGVRDAAEGLMVLLGFRRHKRGEWRMLGGLGSLRRRIDKMTADIEETKRAAARLHHAPPGDAEAVAMFAAARKGDAAAVAKLPELIRARGWVDRIGDIGRESTRRIAHRAAGGDPVKAAAVELKAQEVWDELAGPAPTALERLILRRVVNAWVAAHAAECALAADTAERNRLESIVGKAERRLLASVRELAVVRRLEAPAMLARLEAASAEGPRRVLVEVTPTESAAVPSAD